MRSRSLVAVLAVGVVLSTAACSTQTNAPTGSEQSSTRAATPLTLTAANFITSVSGAQQAAKSAHMQMTLVTAGENITAEGDVLANPAATNDEMSLTMNVPGASGVKVKFIGGILYFDLGTASQNKYVKIDPSDQSDPLAKTFSGLLNEINPSNSLAGLKGAIKSVKVAGPAVAIDGVKATPYDVVVNTSALRSSLGLSGSAAAALPAQIEYEYWVGPDNPPRRMTYSASGTSEKIEFTKWGEPVSVQAPTADQITTVPGL
jgi:hypothetical protein